MPIALLALCLTGPASGGPNLILDGSSFETGYDGFSSFLAYTWIKHGLAGDPRRGEIDPTTAAHGDHSLKLRFVPPFGREGFSPWCTFRWIKLEQGKTYTVSLYAKGERDGLPLTVSVGDKWQDWGWSNFRLTTEWKRYSNRITMGETEGSYAWVLIPFPEDGVAWIDGVQLEEGDLTDYAPGRPVDLGLSCNHPTKNENLYFGGEDVRIRPSVFSETDPGDLTIRYSVEDYFGNTPYSGERPPARPEIRLGKVPLGSYRATVEVIGGSGEVFDAEELIFGVIDGTPREPVADSHFGLHGFAHSALEHLGVRWLRTYLLAWPAVQPEDGPFSWPEEREEDQFFLRSLDELGISALPVLAAVPAWANSDTPTHGGWSKGQSETAKMPRLDAGERYVFETVSRYKDRFTHWEVMNEPTAWMNAEDFLPILKTAHEAAKRADPDCLIVAGDTAWADNE
ncbi:MAG TPA: carbohydrate binding domain-containing protein, partial [Armatimonadota bacterium]|nr:carbohydrate binding domain-containing protein [Armatimonadota bacterium]